MMFIDDELIFQNDNCQIDKDLLKEKFQSKFKP